MDAPSAVSKCGAVQPPSAKPPVGSSPGPPGACMTPSRLVNVATMILRMLVSVQTRLRRSEDVSPPRRAGGPICRLGPRFRGDDDRGDKVTVKRSTYFP